jgi:hypothetical protein
VELSIQIEEEVVLQLATYLEKGDQDEFIAQSFSNLVASLGVTIIRKYLKNLKKDIKENNDLSLGITAVFDFNQLLENDLDPPENLTVH